MIGDRIKYRRKELGISQDELAKRVGYKYRSSIQRIEAGTMDFPQSKLSTFASALATTEEWLIADEPSNPELGNYNENKTLLENVDPGLIPYLIELSNPKNKKRILFEKVRDLEPDDVESLLRAIRFFEEGKR